MCAFDFKGIENFIKKIDLNKIVRIILIVLTLKYVSFL